MGLSDRFGIDVIVLIRSYVRLVGGFGVMGWIAASEYGAAQPDPLADAMAKVIEHLKPITRPSPCSRGGLPTSGAEYLLCERVISLRNNSDHICVWLWLQVDRIRTLPCDSLWS